MSVVALCGGVGGAKLAMGLYKTLPRDTLTVVVNTGDDFTHLGLRICPDIDTVLYTLSGLSNAQQGWGRENESWTMMTVLGQLGGETWFRLGDGDMALHLRRTAQLAAGATLSGVTRELCAALGIDATVLPMSDGVVATRIDTDEGELAFQDYFVRRRCEPRVRSIRFDGANSAFAAPGVIKALDDPELEAIILCPSNPYLSIDPLLALADLRMHIGRRHVPLLAISPLVAGRAVKGPTAKIMQELGVELSNASIAAHYGGLLDALIVDAGDADSDLRLPIPVYAANTLMHSMDDRCALAAFVMQTAGALRRSAG
jgi:LPPG:FO 2-phospho-L-lactate transferase